MKITDVRTIPLRVPASTHLVRGSSDHIYCLLIELHTDVGHVGSSFVFAFHLDHLRVMDTLIAAVRESVIGEDPACSGRLVANSWSRIRFLGQEGATAFAISAVERASWDLVARSAGLPLSQLFGAVRDSVPVYVSGLWLSLTVDELVDQADAHVTAGHRAIKMRVGKPETSEDLGRVRAVRTAVGPSVRLMVDANKRLTREQALRLGRGLEDLDITWLEEPLDTQDLSGTAHLARALDVPIALGESEFRSAGLARAVDAGAVDILMPDLGRVGGYREFFRAADYAASRGLAVSPHHYPHENLQLLASVPNGTYLEYLPWFDELFEERIEVVDGRAHVPQGAGTGFTLNRNAIRQYIIE